MTTAVNLIERVFDSAGRARMSAAADGWARVPNTPYDAGLMERGGRVVQLTCVGRDWCWTEVRA